MPIVNCKPTIANILSGARQALRDSSTSALDAEVLLAALLRCDKVYLYSHPEQLLSVAQQQCYDAWIRRRMQHEPVAYIVGYQPFYRECLYVDRRVLIPRPETELLVEQAIARFASRPNPCIADVGTGSGNIAIGLARALPKARIYASDTSLAALRLAQVNAARYRLSTIDWHFGWYLPVAPQRFDLVCSNLPYIDVLEKESIAASVRCFEPAGALYAEQQGLARINALVAQLPARLGRQAMVMLEIGAEQSNQVASLFTVPTWHSIEVMRDLQGLPRLVMAQLNQPSLAPL